MLSVLKTTFAVSTIAGSVGLANAAPIASNQITPDQFKSRSKTSGFVQFPMNKSLKNKGDSMKIKADGKGSKGVDVMLGNEDYYYQIDLGIGTPAQNVSFTIDTGSSDLWVMRSTNPYCTDNPFNLTGIDCEGSLYRPEDSPTFQDLKEKFFIGYGDGTTAEGTMCRDVLRIGNITLQNATFALADVVNSTTCVFGIGFPSGESSAHSHHNESGFFPTYFNVPTLMKKQGYIHTNSYSLFLDDQDAKEGSILFGAIDPPKFEDKIQLLPIYNNFEEISYQPSQLRVLMHGMAINNNTFADCALPVLLDSGTSYSYLPKKIVDVIGEYIGFHYNPSAGLYIGCTDQALSRAENLQIQFHGAVINFPMKELLVPLTFSDDTSVFVSQKPQSVLAIGYADDPYSYILGDVFLRSMYAVFDLDHYQIGIAQAKVHATESNPVPIIAGIPHSEPAPDYEDTDSSDEIVIFPLEPNNATCNKF